MSFNILADKRLSFPKKSHRKIINIPRQCNDLAELMGIVLGDGGINNGWQLIITLNSIADKQYSLYVEELLNKLFKIHVYKRKRPNQNTLDLICSSTTLVDYLIYKGAVRGNKIKQQIDIPAWILKSKGYKKRFVRGVMDTDGGLFIHKHFCGKKFYHNIGLCFTSHSTKLVTSVKEVLDEFKIESYITDKGRRIYIYSAENVKLYLEIFGSMNSRINSKFAEWLKIKRL